MRLIIRNFQFEADQVQIGTTSTPFRDSAGNMLALYVRMSVSGFLLATTQAALKTLQNNLDAALKDEGSGDFLFLMNDGQPSSTKIFYSETLGGIRLEDGPNYPGGVGDWVQQRGFNFRVMAMVPKYADGNDVLESFSERVMYSGGGPMRICRNAVNTDPVEQVIYPKTFYTAVQLGEAVGFRRLPDRPPPIWPTKMNQDPDIEVQTPERIGDSFHGYKISWRYNFVSAQPLTGLPNAWPGV